MLADPEDADVDRERCSGRDVPVLAEMGYDVSGAQNPHIVRSERRKSVIPKFLGLTREARQKNLFGKALNANRELEQSEPILAPSKNFQRRSAAEK